jgi:glucokinase
MSGEKGPAWLLGVEIGGTKLQLALGRGDGKLAHVRRTTVDVPAGAKGILDQISRETDLLAALAEIRPTEIAAAGFGFGGPVDANRGVVIKSHHVAGWDGFDLAGWARKFLRVPVVSVQNDADTAALGEARHGAGQGKDPLLYVTIGSGIGAGLILKGSIYRGSGLGAAELGHVWASPPEGKAPGETVEQAASGWSITRRARAAIAADPRAGSGLLDLVDGQPDDLDTETIALAAGLDDPLAKSVLSHATRALSLGLAHAITLMAPARIILGGGVSLIGDDLWFRPIRQQVEALAFPPFRGTFDIVPAKLGEEVVLHGALALAREALTTI